ncbi:Arm DNA-binding domain-containing protein [Legionella sp. CNM-1927-20]|uniref:Arm DNA-binding domain-containing protein n=1 Tax=Legionella sp. CNM-1927-20 TaxID=3422221 RepID=UPI00403B2547
MPLTDVSIHSAKIAEKIYKMVDERGLYLEVAPSGGKWRRFRYRFEGKDKRIFRYLS